MTAFLDNFNPFRHDVLYGLQGPRETYVLAYIEKTYNAQSPQVKSNYPPLEPDERFPEEFASEVYTTIEEEGIYINSYNEPITSGDFSDVNRIQLVKPANKRIAQYVESLNKTRYSVSKIGAATLRSLAKGDERLLAATGVNTISAKEHAALRLHLAVRRACKFGIEYMAQDGEAVVHYILDGIKSEDLVNQTTYGVMGGATGVPITTSEIRYMFRNWFSLKKRAIERKIIFYRDQAEVRAPWYDTAALWIPYARHRLDKFLRSKPRLSLAQQNNVEAFHRLADNKPTEALQKFFSLPTSRGVEPDVS